MKYSSVAKHLRPPRIEPRKSTLRSQFRRAVVPGDVYDDDAASDAMSAFERDGGGHLLCVYCSKKAQSWDHVYHVGGGGEGARRGHWLRNLVPACSTCNNAKGKADVEAFFRSAYMVETVPKAKDRADRLRMVLDYANEFQWPDPADVEDTPEWAALWATYDEIARLLAKADEQAARVQERMRERRPRSRSDSSD